MKSVAIIVPTIISTDLEKCLLSILGQTYQDIEPHVIIDGLEFHDEFDEDLSNHPIQRIRNVVTLPDNVGSRGFYGHRILAAWSYLCNQDYIMFLDQDNWIKSDHVESMVSTLESNNYDWVYSLRNIHYKDGTFICKDNAESLGKWSNCANVEHVDTSCFLIKREVLVSVGHFWYGSYGQDRVFYKALSHYYPNFGCTGRHTLNYRVGGNDGSLNPEFIIKGNAHMAERYGTTDFPWLERNV